MKSHVLRLRAGDIALFEAIRSGRKPVETRAATVQHQGIVAGDTLVFLCGKESFSKRVRAVKHFATIDELFQTYKVQDVFPDLATVPQAWRAYAKFSGYLGKIKANGLFAFELENG